MVPSFNIEAVIAASPLSGRLELIRTADESDRERDERQIVPLGNDQVRAVGQLVLRPGGNAQPGALPGGGTLRAIEWLLRRTQRRSHSDNEARMRASLSSVVS